jgi:hypothetical protein
LYSPAKVGIVLLLLIPLFSRNSFAQFASGGSRPFVTGIRTVVGPNGQIGGISVDANGTVTRSIVDPNEVLKQVRFRNQHGSGDGDVSKPSNLRKISLRQLEQQIRIHVDKGEVLPDELEYLAGLQGLEYVFVYPEEKDIVIAGPAGGWVAGPEGSIVGKTTGKPVMHLTDLLIALRLSRATLVQGLTCSIDATAEGLQNYARFNRLRTKMDDRGIELAKQAIGPFEISLSGVPEDSHFACVMVAADVMLKRIGMQLEPSPVKKVPSYLQMLKVSRKSDTSNTMPRWWLEMDYQPLVRDADGLSWKIDGGVKAMTEAGFMTKDGSKMSLDTESPVAKQWAENFTAGYDELSRKLPVFSELRNAMDLAVLGAMIARYRLDEKSSFDAGLLRDETKLQSAKFNVPRKANPQMTLMRKNRGWILSVSGGVDIDCWSVVSNPQTDDDIAQKRRQGRDGQTTRWWWD